MWKVMIVEDEVFVRESVREIINWEEIGFTVIAEAGNGREALEQMKIHHPDLILTDIIMPEMDGLELLKQAREIEYNGKFIMLTCMGEFEYVRQAMEYGASNYILKLSMSVQSLRETLQKISKEFQQRTQKTFPSMDAAYQQAWEEMDKENNRADKEGREGTVNHPPSPYVTVMALLHGDSPLSRQDFERFHFFPSQSSASVLHMWHKYGVTTAFLWSTEPEPVHLEGMLQPPYPIVYSPSVPGEYWKVIWRQVLRRMDYYWYHEQTALDRIDAKAETSPDLPFLWMMEMELLEAMEQGNLNRCSEKLRLLWMEMERNEVRMAVVKHTAERWMEWCCRIANRPFSDEICIHESSSHRKLCEWLDKQIQSTIGDVRRQSYEMTDHPEMNRIIQYIHEHYNQDITVKMMAEIVVMGENYVSALFKRKTGKTLIHYLHEVRIRKAKELLAKSEQPVHEIGQKVGFASDNYFIKIFKRLTEMTPNDYRKSVR